MDVLSEEIWHYHNSVTQSEKMLNRKLHLRDMLYYSICPVFPMCGLYVVGSSLNGFGNNTSDMDLCLMITNKDLDQKTDAVVVLNMILSTLQHTEWVSHQKLILAKVPILRIKFAPPFSDITVDLNANNSVAIKNTHLLCYYSSFDWRVRPLVSVVKEWAKRKGINDANRSSFTSYSLVLMVIHYLQCGTEPGVLPSLQQMFPRRFANKCDVRTLNVTLPLDPPSPEWQYADKSTLGELLIGFLDYYANKFDYDRDAISVRLGKRIDRAVIARQRPNGGYQQNGTNWRSQWRCICIEEPFTYSNTAHSIYDEMVFDAIKTAFREAHQELDTTRDLQRLLNCKPIPVNPPMGGAMVYVSSYNSTREMSAGSTAGDSPTSGHSRRSTPRGSSSGSSISTAHSAASSSGSSSSSDYGEDQDHDRLADVADVSGVPLQRPTKPRSRRISRPNGSIPTCLPTSPPKIPVTTAAEQ
ncbi:PAP/25A associated domain protein [Cooperia oncophora]